MDTPLTLPAGFSARTCTTADVHAVFELIAACEEHDVGEALIDLEDIESEWMRPTFELERDTIAVVDDASGRIVAQGEMTYENRADCAVHPDRRGRGIGSWLVAWTEERARSRGASRVGQTVVDTAADAVDLFERRGYEPLWTSWILQIRFADTPPETPTLPDGYGIRDFVPGTDDHGVHAVIDAAFLEWSDREPEPFEEWRVKTIGRQGFEPWLLPLVVGPSGDIVGAAFLIDSEEDNEGWVQQLAVAREHRGLGLGRALLDESFERFRARGRTGCGLNTDLRTGALGLYEHVGMSVKSSYTHHALRFSGID
jgi:GNAT superfamily N-acetyltransferase